MRPEDLPHRWLSDVSAVAPRAGAGLWAAEGALLVAGWSEHHRSYHTLEHLAEVCTALDELVDAGVVTDEEARVGRVAGWFHDLAYDPRAAPGSNEHRSAALARDHLHRLGVDDSVVETVERLVLLTLDHDVGASDASPLHDAFHDADLWILSAPRVRYDAYTAQVRREFADVPPAAFAAGRRSILQRFADRESLYRTAYAQERWTGRARDNLERELEALRTP